MGDPEEWVLSPSEQSEAQKLVALRDAVLAECSPTHSKRREIEKRVRSNYRANSDYKKHIRNGRYDLIPKSLRDSIFTSQKDLEHAYYDNYKSRDERDDSGSQHEPSMSSASNEWFYEETARDTSDSHTSTGHDHSKHVPNPNHLKSTVAEQQVSSQSFLEQDQPALSAPYGTYGVPYNVLYPPGAVLQPNGAQYPGPVWGGPQLFPLQQAFPLPWGMTAPQQMQYMQQMIQLQTTGQTTAQSEQNQQPQDYPEQHAPYAWGGNRDLQPY